MSNNWYFALGFLAQALFSARVLIQWGQSEKKKKVVSPTSYWVLSLIASFLFLIYGWLRGDFVIIFGQLFSYYIYIWNIHAKGYWQKLHSLLRILILGVPIFCLLWVMMNGHNSMDHLFGHLPIGLILFGSAGQVFLTLRFIYQFLYSRKRHESILPTNFWLISIIGSGITVVYGIYRQDPVLILGHSAGLITYIRNFQLSTKKTQ